VEDQLRRPLFEQVIEHLRQGLSPEQIAFTLSRILEPARLSHETIYVALYAIHRTDEDLSVGTLAMPRGQRWAHLLTLLRRPTCTAASARPERIAVSPFIAAP
jgi:IS30 family transposase